MLHFEVLSSKIFIMNQNVVPWIKEQRYIKMLFQQFSNMTMKVKVVGKVQEQHFNVWLFSNPEDKVMILVKSRRQICPIVFLLFWTLSTGLENNDALKCQSCIFPTTLIYVVMLENCQSNFECMVVLQSRGQDLNFC